MVTERFKHFSNRLVLYGTGMHSQTIANLLQNYGVSSILLCDDTNICK